MFSIGDVNGVGIEVLARALAHDMIHEMIEPVVVCNDRLLREYLEASPSIPSEPIRSAARCEIASDAELMLGHVDARAGLLAYRSIVEATERVVRGEADALVTMPVSKEGLHAAGCAFAGHTELIASIAGGEPMMILLTTGMLVALATVHVPLAQVPSLLSTELIVTRGRQLARALRDDFARDNPRLAVLALNPHAGESGLIGDEEIDVLTPAIEALRSENIDAAGPLPADGFFARYVPDVYDGILAMYHDQGLIPLKLFARGGGVNFTASLPIVRTSPDHGTAYSIAGRGIADERSTVEAITVAVEVVRNRRGIVIAR